MILVAIGLVLGLAGWATRRWRPSSRLHEASTQECVSPECRAATLASPLYPVCTGHQKQHPGSWQPFLEASIPNTPRARPGGHLLLLYLLRQRPQAEIE